MRKFTSIEVYMELGMKCVSDLWKVIDYDIIGNYSNIIVSFKEKKLIYENEFEKTSIPLNIYIEKYNIDMDSVCIQIHEDFMLISLDSNFV